MDDSDKLFLIEQIEGRRVRNGGYVEYYIKWAGYIRSENTWEPKENLNEKFVRNFELLLSIKHNTIPYPALKKFKDLKNLKPDEIIGATYVCGNLLFLMKWKNTDEMNFVLAKEANVKCPQVVIRFYETHIPCLE